MELDLQRKRDLGKILDDTFAIYRAYWRTLLAVTVLVVVPVYLIAFGVGLGWLWEGYDPPQAGEVRLEDLTEPLIGLAVQLAIVWPLVTAMAVHVVRAAGSGQELGVGAALRVGVRLLVPLVLTMVLVALGIALGLFAFIIPGLILWVRWSVVPAIVVIEGLRGPRALGRAIEITRGQGMLTFLTWLIVTLLTGVFTSLIGAPLQAAAESADSQAPLLLAQMLGVIITVPIATVALTLLYYSLLAPAGQQRPVGPPPPALPEPQRLPGVPGTFGEGFSPPVPPESR